MRQREGSKNVEHFEKTTKPHARKLTTPVILFRRIAGRLRKMETTSAGSFPVALYFAPAGASEKQAKPFPLYRKLERSILV